MQRARCSFLAIATFLFSLTLPFLHLHPAAALDDHHLVTHHHDFVVHSHLPDAREAGADGAGGEIGNSEIETRPIDLVLVFVSPIPHDPQVSLLTESAPRVSPERAPCALLQPEPEAQPPPGFESPPSLRGPPA